MSWILRVREQHLAFRDARGVLPRALWSQTPPFFGQNRFKMHDTSQNWLKTGSKRCPRASRPASQSSGSRPDLEPPLRRGTPEAWPCEAHDTYDTISNYMGIFQ